MTTALKAIDGSADLPALMTELVKGARAAARVLALAPPEQKNRALQAIERAIRANAAQILAANAEDVAEAKAGGATSAFVDRLTLTQARVDAMADGVAIVRGPDTHEIGRGLVAYDAEDADKIKGRSSKDVALVLGIAGRAEMIHRDDLVVGPTGTVPAK